MANLLKGKRPSNWTIAISAIVAIFVISVAGTIYYGTVIKPAEDLAATKKTCTTFANGKAAAERAFLDEASRTDQEPNELTAVSNYMKELFKGTDAAFKLSVGDSPVQSALVELSVKRLSIQANQGQTALMTLDQAATQVTTACAAALAGQ
ncbi:MAG: hypothetical protein ACKORF_03875 [Micrococcales bacterium]